MSSRGFLLAPVCVALALLSVTGCASAVVAAPAAEPLAVQQQYVVGGHVTGLQGIGLSLRTARGEELNVDDDGKFVFGARLEDGSDYAVTIAREPISPVQTCVVTRGNGKIAARNAMHVSVVCSTIGLDAQPHPAEAHASR